VRRRVILPTGPGLLRRILLPLATATVGIACLSAPATAAGPPAAPVVTPSTTDPVGVGTPMTMSIAPGSASDEVYGYAWTWQSSSNAPTYTALPSCGSGDATGGIHFVCGSSVTVRVSPEEPPFARFTAWAFDASGNRSAASTVAVDATHDVAALYPVTHQWTTDQFSTVSPAADCGPGALTVDCVPDTAGVDDQHPNGARPLLLPPGVTWDGSGGGVPGVLTFGSGNRLPAGTLGSVVDSRQSFTAGAWLTPSASPAGAPATAIAQAGPSGTGFEFGLTADGRWQFRVHGSSDAAAVAAFAASPGVPVYVAGVADAINREVRLYVNGTLTSIAGFTPAKGHSPDGVATVGGRLARSGLTERWTGQVGNPVLAQAALTGLSISTLSSESFFWGGGLD
jgi:Concanavalin A-like lectin/glucanases superfamily